METTPPTVTNTEQALYGTQDAPRTEEQDPSDRYPKPQDWSHYPLWVKYSMAETVCRWLRFRDAVDVYRYPRYSPEKEFRKLHICMVDGQSTECHILQEFNVK